MSRSASHGALWASLLLLGPTSAWAQPGPQWLVLAADEGVAVADAPAASRRAADELRLAAGGRAFDSRQARQRFEQRGSSPPMMASHSDLDALARDAQMALYHVASGLPGRARRDVERALTRADKVLESLNRESMAAQHLLDACLYLVRAHLQSRQRVKAREQALECKRLVPDIEPDGTMHPPDVIGMLAEAEAYLRRREPGSLRVESAPAGCAVYVNGRRLGKAPLELPQLSPGEYRVQAECREGELGRVHRVAIGTGRVERHIDTHFDEAVQTQMELALRYVSSNALQLHARNHATQTGRVVGAREVLLVRPLGEDLQATRIRVADGELLATVVLPPGTPNGPPVWDMDHVLADLMQGRFLDYRSDPAGSAWATAPLGLELAAPEPVLPSRAPAPVAATQTAPSGGHNATRLRGLGYGLGAVGAAAMLASVGTYAHLMSLESTYADSPGSSELERLESFEFVPLALGLSGSALAVASLPLWLPERRAVPGWAIALGGVGMALAAVGTGFLIAGSGCDDFDVKGRCTDRLATSRFGAMLAAWSAPLLGVPFVYLLRPAGGGSDMGAVRLRLAPNGAALQIQGDL